MPLKTKLHKATRLTLDKSDVKDVNQANTSGTTVMTPEQQLQFETELCWCIQQFQTALKSGKLNTKQVQDHTRALNTLMNNSSVIKKRQVMRVCFGDYRAKMALEDKKKSRSAVNMKVKPATPSKKSVFIKKSSITSAAGNMFRFNFESPSDKTDDDTSVVGIKLKDSNDKNMCSDFQFIPSDNGFRFSFNVNEDL